MNRLAKTCLAVGWALLAASGMAATTHSYQAVGVLGCTAAALGVVATIFFYIAGKRNR